MKQIPNLINYNMGTNSSKIKDIIYVTGQSLDPQNLHHNKVHNPHKQVSIDYKTFLPKKFYKQDATKQELEAHLKEINRKEDLLKQFKHYKDFDRTDFKRMNDQSAHFQIYMEEFFKCIVVAGFCFARISAMNNFRDYFTVASIFRLFFPIILSSVPLVVFRTFRTHEYHIVNHQYFRMPGDEVSQYIQYDQKFNLYKDVQDMKYNFKYPSRAEFYKVRRPILDKQILVQKSQFKDYYEYESGLKKEPLEEFALSRQKQRVGNWQILTEQEKKIISKQIDQRKSRQDRLTK